MATIKEMINLIEENTYYEFIKKHQWNYKQEYLFRNSALKIFEPFPITREELKTIYLLLKYGLKK